MALTAWSRASCFSGSGWAELLRRTASLSMKLPSDLAHKQINKKLHGCARGKQEGWDRWEGLKSTVLTGVCGLRRRQWRMAMAIAGSLEALGLGFGVREKEEGAGYI